MKAREMASYVGKEAIPTLTHSVQKVSKNTDLPLRNDIHLLAVYSIQRIIRVFHGQLFIQALLFNLQLNSEFLGLPSAMRNDGEP